MVRTRCDFCTGRTGIGKIKVQANSFQRDESDSVIGTSQDTPEVRYSLALTFDVVPNGAFMSRIVWFMLLV